MGRATVGRVFHVGVLSAVLFLCGGRFASGQALPTESADQHSPRAALLRALAVPGWGQIYNKQYVKLPLVYGAMGGLAYAVVAINDDYILYRRAYRYKAFQELVESGSLEENPHAELKGWYDRLESQFGPISSTPIRGRRDNLRRNRDLSVFGVGLVYGLAVLDAFVSAHLLDFDVGDDLSIAVAARPRGLSLRVEIGGAPRR